MLHLDFPPNPFFLSPSPNYLSNLAPSPERFCLLQKPHCGGVICSAKKPPGTRRQHPTSVSPAFLPFYTRFAPAAAGLPASGWVPVCAAVLLSGTPRPESGFTLEHGVSDKLLVNSRHLRPRSAVAALWGRRVLVWAACAAGCEAAGGKSTCFSQTRKLQKGGTFVLCEL